MRPIIRMHACDYDCIAAHGAQWQELELIFGRLLQHGNMRERRERVVRERRERVAHASLNQWKRSCMRVVYPRKQNVSVYKNARTIIRWLLPALKGFYDTHAQLTSLSYIHTKCREGYVCTQTLIGVFFVHRNGNMHACLTRGWNLFYFNGRHL